MTRLLLDQGIPRSAVFLLQQYNFDVVHVADIEMSTASDIAIIDYARKELTTAFLFKDKFGLFWTICPL